MEKGKKKSIARSYPFPNPSPKTAVMLCSNANNNCFIQVENYEIELFLYSLHNQKNYFRIAWKNFMNKD